MKTSKRKNGTRSVLANLAGKSLLAAAAFAIVGAGTAQAAYVTIGDPGNAVDPANGAIYGDVGYTYQISATQVSEDDYQSVMFGTTGTALPKVSISLYGAMEFANKLTTDAGGTALYVDDGSGVFAPRKSRADLVADGEFVYAIPTDDEWYKAAYYDLDASTPGVTDVYTDYANGANIGDGAAAGDPPPTSLSGNNTGWNYNGAVGSHWNVGGSKEEQNGTYDMMGNVWEWVEDAEGVIRGGRYSTDATTIRSSFRGTGLAPTDEHGDAGFRVVAIPEPASGALFVLVSGLVWFVRRRVRA